jgi:CheY-like chemotaxis protein
VVTVASRTVLVVDDEEALRRFVCRALERDGYATLEAADCDEAIDAACHYPHRIDLVVTDVHMPRLLGHELIREILPRRPGTRVLYMSGFLGDVPASAVVPLLEKPFTVAELRLAVQSALSEARAA